MLLAMAAALLPGAAYATTEQILANALQLYAQGQAETDRDARLAAFQQAEQEFAGIIEAGTANAEIYTNRGTAALQSEQLGQAVLAYRQALRLDPDNTLALRNLSHTRSLLPAWLPRPGNDVFDSFFFWRNAWSVSEQAGVAGLCFLLAALLLAVGIRWRSSFARQLALLPALAWLGLVASIGLDHLNATTSAVVLVDGSVARAADSINAPMRFTQPLPEGTEVTVLAMRDNWVKVALADDQQAWLRRNSLGLVNP